MKRRTILIIRDGWGYRSSKKNNAISAAKTPYTDFLMKKYPTSFLEASGNAVGLPESYQGNSEVGHITLGSGRIIDQSLTKINNSIKNKSFFKNKALLSAINNCKKNNSKLHIAGLLQDKGVHAHENHLFAILELCKKEKFKHVFLHLFTDGRDSPRKDSLKHFEKLEKKLKILGFGEIVTISGRYYSMDRDKRWNRTKKAYEAIIEGKSKIKYIKSLETIRSSYKEKITDEFIIPRVKKTYSGIDKKDSFIFFNFRTDRPRQLMQAICEKKFNKWKRKDKLTLSVAMTQYYSNMNSLIAFKNIKIKNNLGEIVAKEGLTQLRISETEKYAHVTFFFNGQNEEPNEKEDRILIPSPKVATYDLKPEMSIKKISSSLVKEIKKEKYNLIITNLVNGDMVGHTGNIKAIKKAISSVDSVVKKIVNAALKENYSILILADHGNAEDQRDKWLTSHTINKVPCIFVSNGKKVKLRNGGLKDVAPTILKILRIEKPLEMTGKSLI